MTKNVIVLPSITYAQKAKEILRNANIPSKITRARQKYAQSGCFYGLEILEKDMRNATLILRKEFIMFTEVN